VSELLGHFSASQAAGFICVLARISPLFLLAPMFSSRSFPTRARAIAALALTIGFAPLAMRGQEVPVGAAELAGLIAKEILVGMAFAFAIAATFAAVEVAGAMLDTFTGFAFAALVDPLTGQQSAIMTRVYTIVGLAIFVAIGGDQWVIQGLARTYEEVPLLETPGIGELVGGVNGAFAGIFLGGVEVAAPIIIALLLTDVAFGLVSRVVPQLNVFAVGFPAKITVGLLIVGVSLPFAAGWLEDELQASVRSALDTIGVVG
jgi:flagellar biosynthetic protein FliR